MTPARGRRRYVEALGGGGQLFGSGLGGSGMREAGAIATILIMFIISGEGSVMPCAMARSVNSLSYVVRSSRSCTKERSESTLERVQKIQLISCGSSGGGGVHGVAKLRVQQFQKTRLYLDG
jgi:hypothetical protein